ncbi:MAG TPA: hypothetical protein ENJ33_02655 [Thiothrix sp.]|nr:hypothetical protein [Thiothrix sp.]
MIKINSKKSNVFLLLSCIVFIFMSSCSTLFSSKTLSSNIDLHLLNTLQQHEIKIDLNHPELESPRYKTLGLPVIHIPPAMQSLIVTHEKVKPTRYTQKFNVLAQCHFIGLRIELDNKQQTAEWLITPDNHCPSHSPNKVKPFWIVQQNAMGKREVRVAGRTQMVSIWKKSKNKARSRMISMRIEVTKPSRFTGKPIPVMCHAFWREGNDGVYVYEKGFVEVYRDDPMISHKQWMPVKGEDAWVQVNDDFECPVD